MRANLEAPILPGIGLGALTLGTSVSDIEDLGIESTDAIESLGQLVRPSYRWIKLHSDAIGIFVDTGTQKVAQLSAYEGYRGRLFDSIATGMTVRDVLKADNRFYYSEGEAKVFCRGVGWIELDIAEEDPPLDLVPDLPVVAISTWMAIPPRIQG